MLLTVREVAEILGISRSTVYELLYARRFPSVRIGNCRRVQRSDLETFVRDLVEVS
jgi:excisionase family DNA binding protein